MAEVLISPGVLARENDQSQITAGPVQAGAAIIGPTVKGQQNIPKLVTSYSEYLASFGSTFLSGSNQYTFFTSISAYNYFQNGGNSLLVTRATPGAFNAATSSIIQSAEETGTINPSTNVFLGYNSGTGISGSSGTFTGVSSSVAPTGGQNLTLTVLASSSAGKLDGNADAALNLLTVAPVGAVGTVVYNDVPVTSSLSGTGALARVSIDGANAIDAIQFVDNAGVLATGSGYVAGETLTLSTASLGAVPGVAGTDAVFTITSDVGLFIEPQTITTVAAGTGYSVGDVITIDSTLIGNSGGGVANNLTFTLDASMIVNFEAFTLETLAHGNIMNSAGPTGANGTLESGSSDNFRWEVTSPNTSSGVFSLLVRQGNDTTTSKQVVETFSNLSLDPLATNYVSKVIGDQIQTVRGSGTGVYLQSSGSYPNASRYIRVKSVNKKTPNYFDNNGTAKPEFTGSIPIASQGTFGNGVGDITGSGTPSKFYQAIDNTDSQGLVGSDYTTAINLLANRDDFRYNLITAPGLVLANALTGAGWTSIQSNCETRGDAIFVGDLVNYNSSITQITGQAASVDSSYVATYWPWLQIIDPDSRDLVWVPASTLIPGVYAYNDRAGEPWFAPAGINRGGLGAVNQAERKLTNTNRDTLYTAKVNPIASFPGQGIVVFGQKTLQTKASALDRVNVRRLLITLKNYISQIADTLVFEQNTAATRNTFLSQVNPYLESVQQRQGLYAFKVVMDNSNNTPDVIDRNELIGAVYLQPTKTAEFIYLDFNILPTGATFPA
tara:strand:- start:43 stop:2385 length:2343 start_codon:yes stop_codon:yes gene_type:complete